MVASDSTKLSVSSLLNISMSVEKWLPTGYLLKVTTNCVVLWNQKSWCSTLSLYKNKIKGRIFQACSLKQKIKKRRFSVLGKMNFLGRAGEESSPTTPPPLPPIPLLRVCNINIIPPIYLKLSRNKIQIWRKIQLKLFQWTEKQKHNNCNKPLPWDFPVLFLVFPGKKQFSIF